MASRTKSTSGTKSKASSTRKGKRTAGSNGRVRPPQIVRRAIEQVGELTGRSVEGVLGLQRHDDGWIVTIEVVELQPERALLGRLPELAQVGAVELVGLPELVHEPHDLAPVPHDVGRELRCDHEVDRPPVRLLEVDEPPEESLAEDARPRIPLERHGDERREVVARVQLVDELLREHLGAAVRERHLRRADGDPHVRARSA